jgi:hypothetical protein
MQLSGGSPIQPVEHEMSVETDLWPLNKFDRNLSPLQSDA